MKSRKVEFFKFIKVLVRFEAGDGEDGYFWSAVYRLKNSRSDGRHEGEECVTGYTDAEIAQCVRDELGVDPADPVEVEVEWE